MPVAEGSTIDPERTRAAILHEATQVLYERGLDGSGVASSATRLRVSKETLSRHFGTMDGLVTPELVPRPVRVAPGLITGTVLHGLVDGESFGEYQARSIHAYRTTWRAKHGAEPPPVAVAASILPGTTAESRETYDRQRRIEGMHGSRPGGWSRW